MTTVLKAEESKSPVSRLYLSAIRALEGPDGLNWTSNESKNWGFRTLQLSSRKRARDDNEVLTIYANTFNPLQSTAVIRTVKWNGMDLRKTIRATPSNFRVKVTATFSEIPLESATNWINQFIGLPMTLQRTDAEGGAHIRALRVELDYIQDIIELVWTNENPDLNPRWEKVWQEIVDAASVAPEVPTVWESYYGEKLNEVYRLDDNVTPDSE